MKLNLFLTILILVFSNGFISQISEDKALKTEAKTSNAILLDNYLEKRKVNLQSCSDLQINNKIRSIFNRDISYRNICLGLIIGHFSSSEFSFYTHHSPEINKRIIKIIHQRVQNSLSEILD